MINIFNAINKFIKSLKSKTAKQAGTLYGSRILAMFLGLIITPIITRALEPEEYGLLAFILAIICFTSLFFEFGFFSAGARLLAVSKDKKRDQELIGSLTLITIGISLSFFLFLFIFSFFIDTIFHTTVGNILRIISIFAAIFPFQYMLQQICMGANEIKKMASVNIIPKLWYLAGILIIVGFFKLNVLLALVLNLSGIIIAVGLIIYSLRPKFKNLKTNFVIIYKETKEYGIHMYFGRVSAVSTYQLDKIFVSYFVNNLWVGFYNLATVLITPIALLSQTISTSLFKDFANRDKIPRKVILLNFIWLASCVVGLILLGEFIVTILFSDKYLPVVPLILPLALAGFFQGMYQPYNMFLGAHRKGKWLRNAAFTIAGVNIIGNIILIPFFGAMGAAYASLISMCIAFLLYYLFYLKIIKENISKNRM